MNATRNAYRATAFLIAQSLALAASAQIAAPGQDGRAMDANNRVGSGGYNDSGGSRPGVTPNQIIYGNVTGGKGFSGPIGETDPGAFFGPRAGRFSDRFIAGSSGVPQSFQPQTDLTTPQPFYGASRGAAPPLGTVREGFTGAYLGTPLMSELSGNDLTAANDFLSQRLGAATVLGTRSTIVGMQGGEAVLEGPLGVDNQQTSLSGSALYGIQPLRSTIDSLDQSAAAGQNPGSAGLLEGPGDRFRFDSAEMRQMRNELQSPTDQQQQDNSQSNAQRSGLGQPFDSQNNPANNANNAALSSDLQTNQATQRRFTIVSPELQSEQYRELRRRLSQYENPQFAQMQAQHMARLQQQAFNAKIAGGGPTSRPATGMGAGAMLIKPGAGSIVAPPPMKITSLATGIRAKGLHDVLASAEDLMRQGKFQSAIDRYDIAMQIAPNNPLIPLGRANAEVGAGAYRQAFSDLHHVFATDHATLMAQYDVKGWVSADRLNAVIKELGELSAKDPKDEMPEFLMAYIAYNTDDAKGAASHLTEAQKRAGGQDPLIDLLQSEWRLSPSEQSGAPTPAPTDLNK